MRIAHICHGTPGDRGGGSHSFFKQNLRAMLELGHEVHACMVQPREELDPELAASLASVSFAVLVPPSPRSLDIVAGRFFRPETMVFRWPDWGGLKAQVQAFLERTRPDLVWVDAMTCMPLVETDLPLVYGHVDFLHKLQKIRAKVYTKLRRPDVLSVARLERTELELCRRADAIANVSASDTGMLREKGIDSVYMPIVGETVPAPTAEVPERCRIVLFGRDNTAMRASRVHLKEDLWPLIERAGIDAEWIQVGGNVSDRKDPVSRWVCEHFEPQGFVEDLATVFRPGDICLVPYVGDTGFRAKFVTAAAYGLINLGYDSTFACAEEFVPGENCVAADSEQALVDQLARLSRSHDERARLACGARKLYDSKFTLPVLLPRYEHLLHSAVARRAA